MEIEKIDGTNWQDFVGSGTTYLMLGKSDCDACNAWTAELQQLLEDPARWPHVRFGKLLLDHAGLVSFKRANPWVAELEVLPFNVLYRNGEKVGEGEFFGKRVGYSSTFTIKRSEFGMTYGVDKNALGDEVTLMIDLELVVAK